MKIDEQESLKLPEKQQVVETRQVESQYQYRGSKNLVRGLTLWEFDTKAYTLSAAKMEKTVVLGIDGKEKARMSVIYNPGSIYHQAHNRKAAVRKFNLLFEKMGITFRIEK
jgi:hypothetical protein